MAPEALLCTEHNEKVDVYSFAIVAWQVFAWIADPFKKYLDAGDLKALIEAVCTRKERPVLPPNTHPMLVSMIEESWQHNYHNRPAFAEILERLDLAIISSVIPDESSAKFWRRSWGGRVEKNMRVSATILEAPFDTFIVALYSRIGLRLPPKPEENQKYLCLKAILLDSSSKSTVSVEKFSLLIKWFGPLVHDNMKTIVDCVYEIVAAPWFHGDISKEEACNILTSNDKKKVKSGTFLVRLSTSEPIQTNPFTITKLNLKNEIVHQRVYYKDGRYSVPIKDKFGINREVGSTKGLVALIDEVIKSKNVKCIAPRVRFSNIFLNTRKVNDKGYEENMQRN